MTNEKTKTWAAFGGEWIKAADVANNTNEYAIVGVDSQFEEGKGEVLILKISRDEKEQKFGCNKTNKYAVQCECTNGPEESIGRVITFNKVRVAKPGTTPEEMVDGLRLVFKPQETVEPAEVDKDSAGVDEQSNI